ncbi:DUF2938 family protein [Frigidibacter sp. MR17.24]|uniref:DUF2938 family protein n=1 Tax=Frigidibacter sp. MR17.24 TaxID=3127345 RepID=UPI003012C63B
MLAAALAIGVFATAVFDLWGVLVARVLGLPVNDWRMGGRWFSHLLRGRARHAAIAAAPALPGEQAVGWIGHYLVGCCFALLTVAIGGRDWLAAPGIALPLAVGLLTVGFGWFVMSPCMGAGIAAARSPAPGRARAIGLAAHAVFGLAMWAGAWMLAAA